MLSWIVQSFDGARSLLFLRNLQILSLDEMCMPGNQWDVAICFYHSSGMKFTSERASPVNEKKMCGICSSKTMVSPGQKRVL